MLLRAVRTISRPVVWGLGRIKWEQASAFGRCLGFLAYTFSRRYRNVAVENLLIAFPGMTRAEAKSTAKQTFCNFCRGFVEFFIVARFSGEDIKRVVEVRGLEHADEALRAGNGGIFVTAHIGNWEAFARRVALEGYPITVIARNSDDPTSTGMVNEIRERGGYKVLSRDESVRGALRCLRSNEFLGILPDQNTYGGTVFVPFFGRPVATATGVAVFALKTGAPILPAFTTWDEATKQYIATIYPPLETPLTGDMDRDVEAITAAYTAAIEAEVRKSPAEWLWLHNRWKRTHEADKAPRVRSGS